jgi:hypothetical protein
MRNIMKSKYSGKYLAETIKQLEIKKETEEEQLKEQFHLAYNSLKPANLIESAFLKAVNSGKLKDNVINTSAGLTTGFLIKKLFVGSSHSLLKNIFGNVLMFGITNLIIKNPGFIKMLGKKHSKKHKNNTGGLLNPTTADVSF